MTATFFGPEMARVETLKAHWRLYAFEGVVMIVLGVLAIAYPVFATLAVDLYLGCVFLFAGLLAMIAMLSARHVPGFWWALVTALLFIVVGALLLWKPAAGVVSLTIVLMAFFLVEGVFQCVASLSYREVIPHAWGWLLASGLGISPSPRSSSPVGPEPPIGRSVCSPA